jgi:hypothetical protein
MQMDPNIIGICLSILALAAAMYFGLRSFKTEISEKMETIKKEVVAELFGIKENVMKISGRAEDIWQHMTAYLSRRTAGTVEVVLKNFGKTKVSVVPSITDTKYLIQSEKGRFDGDIISKLGKKSSLIKKEVELFNSEIMIMAMANTLRITLPSTDPNICVQYINFFLKWLDTDYIQALSREIEEFEQGIKV